MARGQARPKIPGMPPKSSGGRWRIPYIGGALLESGGPPDCIRGRCKHTKPDFRVQTNLNNLRVWAWS